MSGKEQEFIRQAFDSNYIALLGPMVEAFERELAEELKVSDVLSTASGTAAIHLALRCLDIQPGDALALEGQNIESRPVWKPMHRQPVFSGAKTIGGAVADGFYAQGLCLPPGSNMSQSDQDRVIEIVRGLSAHV
jgi:dTDP-4-amino-4,6-dideoxygalactose transaminase